MSSSWLHRYGQGHEWTQSETQGHVVFERQIGLVEGGFDVDGAHFGGRADLTQGFEVEVRTSLSPAQLIDRITLVWAVLRFNHVLLLSRVADRNENGQIQRCFQIEVPDDGIADTRKHITYLETHGPIELEEFRRHAMNTRRVMDAKECLSHLFILPLLSLGEGHYRVRILAVLAHMISDGLSLFNWMGHFNDLLNEVEPSLQAMLAEGLRVETFKSRLPAAQEQLYPPVAGNLARQRWFWAIIRILRHTRRAVPSGFVNPLRRKERVFIDFEPKFSPALDYTKSVLPPMNTGSCTPSLSLAASKRLARICKEAGTSVGAGVFALVAVVMMEIEELVHPDIPLEERKPFIASFPLNPRPFFGYKGPHDSCMLAFSDGIYMGFLPSSLPIEGRLRLLVKSAHRQLKSYQKRKQPTISSHTPIRMIATNYITAIERVEDKMPPQYRKGFRPQGAYPATFQWTSATCGVSSVGSIKSWLAPGKYDLNSFDSSGKDLVADFRDLKGGVRARDNEFLCGSTSDIDGRLNFAVSYDLSAMDEGLVELWKEKMEGILETNDGSRL